ncbi:hypothetical protein KM043_007500 [Ampulex compressa]|nr:hypothetical protein KM043_007500 [Ampulex compressa]
MEETFDLIKSCIISRKAGMPLRMLETEFKKIVGEPIPYERLGFKNVKELLNHVKGVKMSNDEWGRKTLTVQDTKVSHLARLIERQKNDYMKSKNKYFKRFSNSTSESASDQYRRSESRIARSRERNNDRYHNLASYRFSHDSSNLNSSLSFEEEIENNRPIVIESKTLHWTDVIYEPIVHGYQLLGDDFFLQLTIRNLHQPIWREGDCLALRCGLCISGQTIKNCTRELRKLKSISSRIMIMLGSVDVYNGATSDEMKRDMKELLAVLRDRFKLSNSAITLCTIPPLGNIGIDSHHRKVTSLYVFNHWIRSLNVDEDFHDRLENNYFVIDVYKSFTNENYATEYDLFQLDTRRVSGCKHSYLLWNKEGRKHAMEVMFGI